MSSRIVSDPEVGPDRTFADESCLVAKWRVILVGHLHWASVHPTPLARNSLFFA